MPLIGVDPNPTRRALAKLYGASHVIDAAGDVLAEIRKVAPQGVDLAVESSGQPMVMEQAINATRQQGGRAVVIGNARHGTMPGWRKGAHGSPVAASHKSSLWSQAPEASQRPSGL